MSSRAEFQVVYDGSALREGTMDVRDLAPALLALSSLIDQINSRVNGAEKPVTMQFKAAKEGSFIVELLLETTWLQDVVSLFSTPDAQGLKLVMDTLWGGGVAGGTIGLFQVIKFLKGRPASRVDTAQTPSGTVVIYNISGDKIITSFGALEMANDPKIRSQAARVVKPLEKEGIDTFYVTQAERQPGEPITKEDLEFFTSEQATELPESDSVVLLQLMKADVANPKSKWQFFDGANSFYALITDEAFMQSIQNGSRRVGHADALKAELVRRQTANKAGQLKAEFEVRRVLNYYEGGITPSQLSLEY